MKAFANLTDPRIPNAIAWGSAALGMLFPILALIGWIWKIPALSRIEEQFPPMTPNTAIMLIASSLSFAFQQSKKRNLFKTIIAKLLSLFTLVLSSLTFSEFLFDRDLKIDSLLAAVNRNAFQGSSRPSAEAALFLILCSFALLFSHVQFKERFNVQQVFGLFISALSEFFLIGYLTDSTVMYSKLYPGPNSGIALPTLLSIFFLSIAMLTAQPKKGFMATVFGASSGGVVLRNLFWLIILIPVTVTYFLKLIRNFGIHDPALETAYEIMFTIVVFFFFIWKIAKRLEKLDAEKTQAVETLNQSEIFYRTLISSASEAIFISDAKGNYKYVNRNACSFTGYSENELIGKNIAYILPPEELPRLRLDLTELSSESKTSEISDWNFKRKDGQIIPGEVSVKRLPTGDLVAYVRDLTQRKLQEALLTKWKHLFENAGWGVAIGQPRDNTIGLINPAFVKMYGCNSAEELIGRPVIELFATECRKDLPEHLNIATKNGHHSFESIHVRKDGSHFPVFIDISVVCGTDGRPDFRAVNVRDITQEKKAELEIKAAEQKWKTLLESFSDAIIVADQNGTIDFINNQTTQYFGYSPQELIGQKVELLVPDRYRKHHVGLRENYMKHPVSRPIESGSGQLYGRKKNGSEIPVEISLSPTLINEKRSVIAAIRDISEKVKSEIQKRFLDQLVQLLNESLDLEVMLEKIARLSVQEFSDWCVIDLTTGEKQINRVLAIHRDPKKKQTIEHFRVRFPPKINTTQGVRQSIRLKKAILSRDIDENKLMELGQDLEWSKTMLDLGVKSYLVVPLIARNNVLGSISFVAANLNYDESDLHFAEEVSNRAALSMDNARLYNEATAAIRSREDTLAIVSHDLKNPIAAITLNAEMLYQLTLTENTFNASKRVVFEKQTASIKRSANTAERLILDLLDFVKIESGNLRIEKKSESTSEILDEVSTLMKPMADERNLKLMIHDTEALKVNCDRHRIVQALGNLMGNAIKFSKKGSVIDVSVALTSQNEVLFSVKDNGSGISPEALEHIFERYWQPEETKKQGTGLGLSIVKGIIETHRGRVWAESTLGKGSTFFFTLPLSPT